MSEIWLERLEREMKLRGAVILFGNTNDMIRNPQKSGMYTSVVDCVRDMAFNSGYERVIMWNRAEGGSMWEKGAASSSALPGMEEEDVPNGTSYDFGESFDESKTNTK